MYLELKNITKYYGSLKANDDVSIHLNKGELLAIVGENGAGKSTIMKILSGLEAADSGEILLEGEKLTLHSAIDAMHHKICMVHQHFMLFHSMTVAENIVYNNEQRKYKLFFNKKECIRQVEELSRQYGLEIDPHAVVSDCPVGVQQRVEILKILYQKADIMIFDEPTAVLTPIEVDELLGTLRNLSKQGKSVILITHKLQEVMAVADRIVVMRQGRVVGERLRKDTNVQELSEMMIGRLIPNRSIPPKTGTGNILTVKDLLLENNSGKQILKNINIHVEKGEIVGIAGVSGNGQSEMVECIFGLRKASSGSVQIDGTEVLNHPVNTIRKMGVSLIPEDRYLTGSAKDATLEENMFMGNDFRKELCSHGIVHWSEVEKYTNEQIKTFCVAVSSSKQKISELSGGNAQKLIVAREMGRNTPLLIACEPTRGIDIGAIEFIHDKLVERRNEGKGILLVSTELTEIMELSDRIYIMYEGEIRGEFKRGNVDLKELSLLMLGGKSNASG